MKDSGIRGPSSFDSDAAADESFDALFSVIASVVHCECSTIVIGPVDEDDIVQEVSIKVWRYWLIHPITHPRAFIRLVASRVLIDCRRKLKPRLYQSFPVDESGETCEDTFGWLETLPEDDPEWRALNEEGATETTGRVADAIAALSGCQQDAAVCTLKTRVDEWSQMTMALEARGINADLEWPADPEDKRRLQASFSPARRNIARQMGEDLSLYKRF